MPDRSGDKSLPAQVTDLWALVRDYARQETIEPIKGLGRFVAYGLAGSILLGIGLVLLVLAGLRALQTETGDAFDGTWSSAAPYGITIVGCVIVIVLVLARTGRKG